MPRDLFGDVTRPSISVGTRKWYTVPVSLFSHAAIVALLIAIPILAPAAMPSVFADDDPTWVSTRLPTPPPPPAPRSAALKPVENLNAAPVIAPDSINPEKPAAPEIEVPMPGVIGGTDHLETILAPPPVVKPPAPEQGPVRVGGAVRAPQKVREVNPAYPPMAQAARVQGIVIVEATIGEDGHVINARILRSVPLLDQAAVEAVRQWQYTPTLLNGVPVPVIMTVTVNFSLR
jgi:protein TonB